MQNKFEQTIHRYAKGGLYALAKDNPDVNKLANLVDLLFYSNVCETDFNSEALAEYVANGGTSKRIV